MEDLQRLRDALASESSFVTFVAETGADALDAPPGFDIGNAEVLVPMSPLDPFEPDSLGTAVATFLNARTDGYGSAHVNMSDGSGTMFMEAFDCRADAGAIVVVLSPADVEAALLTPVDVELPARIATSKLDATGRTLEIDGEMVKLLGWTIDEYLGRSSIDRVHPSDHDRAIHSFGELLGRPGGQTRIRQRLRHRDGSWRWFEITHTNLLHTDAPHVLSESLDVSSEMAVTLALQEREALLALLTESLPIGVLHLDPTGQVEIVNATWTDLTDLTGNRPGTTFDALVAPFMEHDAVTDLVTSARFDGTPGDVRVSIHRNDAADGFFDLSIRALPGDDAARPVVVTLTDVSTSVALQSRLEDQVREDHLTGALNRLGFDEELSALLDHGVEHAVDATLLYCDLDGFKSVNDTLGHAAGDQLLVSVADAIRSALGPDDLLARLGGDEFVAILRTTEPVRAHEVRRRIDDAVATLSTSMSIGIARAEDGDSFDSLVARADQAMYRQKQHGISAESA